MPPCALIYSDYQFLPEEGPVSLKADSWGRHQLLGRQSQHLLLVVTSKLRGGSEEAPANTKPALLSAVALFNSVITGKWGTGRAPALL